MRFISNVLHQTPQKWKFEHAVEANGQTNRWKFIGFITNAYIPISIACRSELCVFFFFCSVATKNKMENKLICNAMFSISDLNRLQQQKQRRLLSFSDSLSPYVYLSLYISLSLYVFLLRTRALTASSTCLVALSLVRSLFIIVFNYDSIDHMPAGDYD